MRAPYFFMLDLEIDPLGIRVVCNEIHTDEEAVKRLNLADALLGQYTAILHPVLKYLAKDKSEFVFGSDGHYNAHLGCDDCGIDTVCVHIEEGSRKRHDSPSNGSGSKAAEDAFDKLEEWERDWNEAFKGYYVTIGGQW